jgi:hypothetical protein
MSSTTTRFDSQIDDIAEDAFAVLERHRAEGPADYADLLLRLEQAKSEAHRTIGAQVEAIYQAGCDDAAAAERRMEALVRTAVLVVVVAAVAALSIAALVLRLDAQQFTVYLAPVTGMAGTVLGYWFGAAGRRSR